MQLRQGPLGQGLPLAAAVAGEPRPSEGRGVTVYGAGVVDVH
jgi:hypothetical protein